MINPFRNLSTFPTLMKTTKKLATYKQSTIYFGVGSSVLFKTATYFV